MKVPPLSEYVLLNFAFFLPFVFVSPIEILPLYTVQRDSFQWLRRENRKNTKERSSQLEQPEKERSKLEDLIRAEVLSELNAGVRTLPPQCRQIITLILEGKNTREVAETLQTTQGNVKVQKGRGLQLLRKRLPNLLYIAVALIL